LEKNEIFELAKFLQKVCQFRKFQKNYIKFEFLSQKTYFWVKMFGISLEKVQKSSEKFGNRVLQMFGNFGNCSIPKFQKLRKNDVELKL